MPLGLPALSARRKRRLLRDLVQENLELIHGLPPRRRRRRWLGREVLRLGMVLLLPVALYGSSQLLGGRGGREAPRAAAAATPAAAPALAAPSPPAPPPSFPRRGRSTPRSSRSPCGGWRSTPATAAPASAPAPRRGTLEKELTLDIARRLARRLAADAFEPVLTRRGDREVPLKERARLANEAGADLFLSIHLNWIEDRAARGVETYYAGASDDPIVNRLAAAENHDSGYSLADLKPLLERIYTDVRQEESRRLAEVLQGSLVRSLAPANPGAPGPRRQGGALHRPHHHRDALGAGRGLLPLERGGGAPARQP